MSTKTDPGKFDCYANAGPDEEIFTLLARDRHAPYLVERWADMRALDATTPEDYDKIAEAREVAKRMRQWRMRELHRAIRGPAGQTTEPTGEVK